MNEFSDLKNEILSIKEKNRNPRFRELIVEALKIVNDPLDAKWLYSEIVGNYTTSDFRFQAIETCFQMARKLFLESIIDYDYLFWLTSELANPLRKRWTANACLLKAKEMNQVNDYLFTYADQGQYWRTFIALAENVRQIRHAVKFCTDSVRGYAKSVEAKMWFERGQLVPNMLPSLK